MATDKPGFLQGIDETPDEKDVTDVLRDDPVEPAKDTANETTPDDTKPDNAGDTKSDTVTPDNAGDSTTPDAKSDVLADDATVADDKSAIKDDAKDPKDKPVETPVKDPKDAPSETPEQAAARQVQLKWGTFKTPEDAEKAFKEMQRTLTRLSTEQKTAQPGQTPEEKKQQQDKLAEFTALAKTTPMIEFALPDAEKYNLEDGRFDIASYMRDFSRAMVLGVQQSVIGGKLGAMQFGLLQQAMGEEYQGSQDAVKREQESKAVEAKIFDTYPIFKENEQVAELLEQAIYGESARRNRAAQAEGKEPVPMKDEEFMAIAEKIVKNMQLTVAPKVEEVADTVRQTPTMQPTGTAPVSQEDKDIDAMMNAKNKSGSIF